MKEILIFLAKITMMNFPPQNFVSRFAKCAANTVALDPLRPFASNIKELPMLTIVYRTKVSKCVY